MTHILWVEDQFHWIDKLTPILKKTDFGDGCENNNVETYKFADAACQAIKQAKQAPDIAILDANMGGNDDAGFTVSRSLIKKWPDLPIIYLSEHSGTGIERRALEKTETQDFIAKHQQNIDEILCWRIKATLRQRRILGQSNNQSAEDTICSGNLSIDLTTWEVYWCSQKLMNPTNSKRPLAPTPRKILRALVESSPRPLTTLQIADQLDLDKFNYASYRQHIKTLRHSFEQVSLSLEQPSFLELCQSGQGIVTFGDEGAYCWKPPPVGSHPSN